MKLAKPSNKSIAFFLPRYHTNLIGVTQYLLKKKIKIKVFSFKKTNIENHSLIKPILIPKFKINFFFFTINLINFIKISKTLKKKKYDLAIIRLNDFQSFFLLPVFLKYFTKIRFIFYSQTDLSYYLNLDLIRRLKYFLFLNFFKAKIITPVFNTQKIQHNKHFLPFPFLLKMRGQKVSKTQFIKILSIGKFQERKNFMLLIKVLESIKINFKLLIIGEKSDAKQTLIFNNIVKYIRNKKLNKKIEIRANVKHEAMHKFYNWCDFFVLASTKEPASISPLEALSFRKPAICSTNNGTKYYIRDNVNGYIFKDNDFKSLKSKILHMTVNYKKFHSNLLINRNDYLNENLFNKIYKKKLELNYDF